MLLVAAFSGAYWLVLAAAVGLGMGSAAFHAAGLSGARELSAGRGPGRATAIFLLGGNGGFAIGAFMGGRILDNYGASTLLIPAALVIAVTPILVWRLRPHLVGLANTPGRTSREVLLGGYRSWLPIVALAVLVISVQTYYFGFTTYLPQYYEAQGNSLSYAGGFSSLFLFFAAIGSFVGGALSDNFPRRMVAVISMLLIAPLSFLTLRAGGPLLALLSILLGLTTNISFPILLLIGQEVMPGGRNSAGGYSFGLAFLARTASIPMVGWLADSIGLLETLTTIGILPVVVVGLFWLLPGEASP
jgi:FSR family fosmidomycin resistance protein-like MFS transporter